MTDKQKKIVDDYISNVKSRYSDIFDFVLFLPCSTPSFWGKELIDRLSDSDREKLDSFLSEARPIREDISFCQEKIQARMNCCIDHVERIAAGTEAPRDAMQLYLTFYGLFDESIRFSALAMQSIMLSERIARLLEKYSDEETNTAARQHLDEVKKILDVIHEEHAATREMIGDQHRHAWERWATVPECVRAIVDMAKTEKADGKNISLPGNENTLRIKISNWLNEHGKRREGTQKKPYFQTADIADAAGVFYKEFEPVQYLREFEKIGIPAERIQKPKKK